MKYDLHMHTKYSPCGSIEPKLLLKIAKRNKLDGVAVTDHNTTKGSREVSRLNKDKDFEVIISNEVRTEYGDVLVYYIQEEIKPRDLFNLLDKAEEQDAIVSIAHPFRPLPHVRFNYPIKEILNKIDAIECINSRTFYWENKKASRIADELNLAKTAGSDAHFGFEIGNAVNVFEGDLRKAIKMRAIKIEGSSLINPLGVALSWIKKRI